MDLLKYRGTKVLRKYLALTAFHRAALPYHASCSGFTPSKGDGILFYAWSTKPERLLLHPTTGKLDAGNVAFNDIFINYVLPGICVGYLTPSGTSTSASVFTPGITFRPFVFPLLIDTIFGNKSDAGHQIADNISFFLGFYNLQEPVYGFAITPLTFDLLQVNQSSNQPAN